MFGEPGLLMYAILGIIWVVHSLYRLPWTIHEACVKAKECVDYVMTA